MCTCFNGSGVTVKPFVRSVIERKEAMSVSRFS